MSEPQQVIVLCLRVEDMPFVLVPSYRERCIACQREVWLDKQAPAEARCLCVKCSIGKIDGAKVEVLPHTLELLQRMGFSVEEIERMRHAAEIYRLRLASPFN